MKTPLKVGSLVFATEQGLGILARDFYANGVITNPLIIKHGSRTNHWGWYPRDTPIVTLSQGRHAQTALEQFCKTVDVMLFLETPFNWYLMEYCRRVGVMTILMVMYECEPEKMPVKPDHILCPSLLDHQYYPEGKYLPVPVDVPWHPRHIAHTYVHNAGNGGIKNRNGTGLLLDAMRYVKSPLRLIIRSQVLLQWTSDDPRVEVRVGTVPRDELYREGDVFVFPESFNGLSLPLQEAYASGMLVVATDRFPTNTYLPHEALIPVIATRQNRIGGCNLFTESIVDPRDIAKVMDDWYGKDISPFSQRGKDWATGMSWQVLGPQYRDYLESLV